MAAITQQTAYRFRNDDGDEVNATWKAAANTPVTIKAGEINRVRFAVSNVGDANPNFLGGILVIAIRINGGAWRTVQVGELYYLLTADSGLVDLSDATEQLAGVGTFIANGEVADSSAATNLANTELPAGRFVNIEHGFIISPTEAKTGDVVEFRLQEILDEFEQYTQVAQATILVEAQKAGMANTINKRLRRRRRRLLDLTKDKPFMG